MEEKAHLNKNIATGNIWKQYSQPLKDFVRSRIREAADAEDLLQDVFLKIHTHQHSIKDEARTDAWVFQIARNAVNDYYRKKRYFVSASKLEIPETETETQANAFETCMMPFIERLPDKYREALVLAELNNVPQNILATNLRLSYSGLKSRVQRARQLLLSYFRECCHIESDKYGNILSHTPKGKCICAG